MPVNSSGHNDKQEPKQSQGSQPEPHPRDGYIIIEQNTWEEAQSANEQADFEVG